MERLAPPELENARDRFAEVFGTEKPIIAMLHVWDEAPERQIDNTLRDLETLHPLVDGLLVENYGWGYANNNRATQRAIDTIRLVSRRVVDNADIPVGVNLLPNDYEASLYAAQETGARFIQMDHLVGDYTHCDSVDPQNLLIARLRHPEVVILGGIHPKYYELKEPEPKITDSARVASERGDGIVVTGAATGSETDFEELEEVRAVLNKTPLVIGSGLNVDNASKQLAIADGAIVGSAFKLLGVRPGEPVNRDLAERLVAATRS